MDFVGLSLVSFQYEKNSAMFMSGLGGAIPTRQCSVGAFWKGAPFSKSAH